MKIKKIFSRIHNLCDSLRGQVPLNEYILKEGEIKFEFKMYTKSKNVETKTNKERK